MRKKPTISILVLLALTAAPVMAELSEGLVAYWPFDGDLLDASGTGAHGTANLGTSATPQLYYAPGRFGDGVYLNNFLGGGQENQFVEITGVAEDTFDFTGGSMSVSFWVKESYFLGAGRTFLGKGAGGSWRLTWSGADETVATPAMFGGLGGTAATGDGSNADQVLNNQMHHLVGVVEAGVGIRLYFDGQLISTAAGNAQLADSAAPLTIGALPGTASSFSEGIIDDLAIWNRALGAGEVALLWNNGTGVSIGQATDDTDSDTDGIPDFYEDLNGMDKNNAADAGQGADDGLFDDDGLTNLEEYTLGTDPNNADSDGDVLKDGEEVNATVNPFDTTPMDGSPDPTDPLSPDSDGDGLNDRLEVLGLRNVAFGRAPTDPNDPDTDDDGASDKEETDFRYNPNDPASIPPPFQLGLAGYWDFEGDLKDSSGLRRDGELLEAGVPAPIGNLQFLTNGSKAGFGTCILNDGRPPNTGGTGVNGPGQSIRITRSEDALDFPGGSVTVSAWVYLYAKNPNTPSSIMAKGTGNNWNLTLTPTNQARWEGGADAISGGGNVGSPVWHHVAAVSEAGVATRLYVDGRLAAAGDAPNLGRNGLPMQIGGNPEAADNTWYGLLDEVAVWGRAMDDGEVRQIWNRGNGVLVSDLIAATDTDGDGMSDAYETAHGLNPNLDDAGGDADGDTLTNKQEYDAGSDPNTADTDGDGLHDEGEVAAGTSSLAPDTDGDGLTDGEELTAGTDGYITDPLNRDTDSDTWTDSQEASFGSNPNDKDDVPIVTRVTVLGTGAGALLGGDLTDPENDGVDGQMTNWNWVSINASSENDWAGEGAYNIFDNQVGTGQAKWCCNGPPQSIAVEFAQEYQLTHFTLTSGNDTEARDPVNWSIQGSNDGVTWEVIYPLIHPGPGQSLWTARNQVLRFDLPKPSKPYTFFKYHCQQTGGTEHQINELELFGIVPPPPVTEDLVITKLEFVGPTLEATVEGMDPAKAYALYRSLDARDFSTPVGVPFTGAATHVFVDPSPPADRALYQIWQAGP